MRYVSFFVFDIWGSVWVVTMDSKEAKCARLLKLLLIFRVNVGYLDDDVLRAYTIDWIAVQPNCHLDPLSDGWIGVESVM